MEKTLPNQFCMHIENGFMIWNHTDKASLHEKYVDDDLNHYLSKIPDEKLYV